jgi:hypothetical protein
MSARPPQQRSLGRRTRYRHGDRDFGDARRAGAKHVAEVAKALHQRSDEPAVVLARVDRPADMEAFIRSHVYNPDYKKLVTPQQLLVGVADGSKTSP